MYQTPRHRAFISYHHDDQAFKNYFVNALGDNFVDESVHDGDIDDENMAAETIRQRIRDDFIRDATVTVVLIGRCTWQRKHVDWEIGSSLRQTRLNSRCGLLGILLPNHPDYGFGKFHHRLVPPRLADNTGGNDPYALVYDWPRSFSASEVRQWIHRAFQRRNGTSPTNGRAHFRRNRSGDCSLGWQN